MSNSILHQNKDMEPTISVAMPVYNGEKYLAEAIDSILAQTYSDFELVIVDDGSTDGSLKILREYQKLDRRICLITRENRGLSATLNEIIHLSRGSLIARMDQDDICWPNRLSSQYEFMQNNPGVIALGSSAYFIDDGGNKICVYIPPVGDDMLRKNFPESPFVHPSVMFTREVFYKAGQYNEKMKWGGEDVVLFERMSRFGKLHNLSEPLIGYRLVPGSLSRKPPAFRRILTEIIINEIDGDFIPERKFELLRQEIGKIDKSKANFDYNFEVAKLYIWSGGVRSNSLRHLLVCNTLKPYSLKVYFMYLLSCLHGGLIKSIFYILKRRKYEPI